MKQILISSVVLSIVLQSSAFAQSSTAIVPAAPVSAPSAAATSTADAPAASSIIHASYTGIFAGPGLDSEAGTTKDGDDLFVSNRLAFKADLAKGIDAGLQIRLQTAFRTNGIEANNEISRFFANFKNVFQYDILSVNLTPRLLLPTSNRAHNNKMTLSPELLIAMNVNPKDSRFSFSYTPQMQQIIYSNNAVATANNGMSFYLLHNLDVTYTLGSTTQITFGYYPEYMSTKQAAFTNSSNEIDLGLNWDFAKGWSINPYIATEMNGLDSNAIGKNMQANLTLSGTFL
jgi:hypothetical protein